MAAQLLISSPRASIEIVATAQYRHVPEEILLPSQEELPGPW